MVMYMNVHTALEQLRQKAEADVSRGPRVSVILIHCTLMIFFTLTAIFSHLSVEHYFHPLQ